MSIQRNLSFRQKIKNLEQALYVNSEMTDKILQSLVILERFLIETKVIKKEELQKFLENWIKYEKKQ